MATQVTGRRLGITLYAHGLFSFRYSVMPSHRRCIV